MTRPRIAVLGAGANGASVGADLTEAGHDVTLIEQWPENVRAMQRDGAIIVEPQRRRAVPVRAVDLCTVAALRGRFDYVLMLMKAYDSRWAAELIRPYLADDGLLVGVQNGMTIDAVAAAVGPARTMGCVIEITSSMQDPGVVHRDSPFERSWFAVGSAFPQTRGREREIAELLGHVGAVEVVDDIRSAKWMKLVSNATTLVTTAIVGMPMIAAAADPVMRDVMLRSGREALAVARASDSEPLPIFGLTPQDLAASDDLAGTLLDTLLSGFVLPHSKTTVLQDWMKGRHSEVDDLNGYVSRVGADRGVATPVNDAVVRLAHRIEAGELEPSPTNVGLLRAEAGLGDAARL